MSVSVYEPAKETGETPTPYPLFGTLSVSALISTILLIMVGSIVRVTGNGLGCPDWPLCHGQAIPPFLASAWVEFFHRLVGGAVVIQIGILIFLAWRRYRHEKWVFRTAVALAFVLTIQVALGGIHVIYELPRWTGLIHTGVAMIVAGLVAIWVAVTQPGIRDLSRRTAPLFQGTRLYLWTAIVAGATYVLLLTGSLVVRTGASLVCPSFPFCGLEVVPDNLRSIVNIQMIHRISAFTVALAIIVVLWYLFKASRQDSGIKRVAAALIALLLLQITLGITNVLFALPTWSRVLHLGTGATIWVFMVILSVALLQNRDQAMVGSGGKTQHH
jgi:heme A synthase